MKSLNSCTIAYKSLRVGAFEYAFTLDNEFFSRFEGSEIMAGNCAAQVQLQRGEAMLEVDVRIDGEVIVACDRCLDDCPVAIDYQGRLIVKFSSEIGEYDGEILWLSPLESEVDLSQYIYESVVLSLPYQRVHAEGECNEEMISKFAMISGEELAKIEAEADGGEAEEGDESDDSQEESHGLSAGDLAKLEALKKMMEEKEN
ncbi:MAG: DUF177 domain-containing protein [Rikenellaceae bacterium]